MEEKEPTIPKTKVVILTAGSGSRLKKRTKYFNKALLRVGNKAVISHTIDQFSNDVEFVIALGYQGDIVKQYLDIAHPEKKFTFVNIENHNRPGSGPGQSLYECRDKLQCPFFFFSCDSIVKPGTYTNIKNNNWIGISLIDEKDTEHYCSAKLDSQTGRVVGLIDKQENGTTYAFVGAAFIKDYDLFWEAMANNKELIKNEIQISPALSKLEMFGLPVFWWDIGSENGLSAARSQFKGIQNLDKLDEELYVIGDYVVKYFYNSDVIKERTFRASQLNGCVPSLVNYTKNFYKYKFVEGKDLFKVPNVESHIENLLNYMKKNLWDNVAGLSSNETKYFEKICKEFYFDKTVRRLEQFREKKGLGDTKQTINGIEIGSIECMFKLLNWDEYIANGIPCRSFHGDTYLGNIILRNDNTFKLIDWRHNFSNNTSYGDVYYDLAKMYNSFYVPSTSLNEQKYCTTKKSDGTIETSIEISQDIKSAKLIFEEWVERNNFDLQKIKILTALVMLSMSPLHENPLDEYLYYFGRYYLQNVMRTV